SRLLYCADVSGVTNVYQIGIDGAPATQLSDNKDAGTRLSNPTWSPDGQRVAWLAYEQAQKSSSIWLLADGRQQQIFRSNSALGLSGWSANGQELILKEIPGRDTAPNSAVDVTRSAISTRDGKQPSI